ncbi:hypothetical protein NPIL_625571 [Nephila pilipes]|uniref:Uncharacterized protein n=1 Tax=Nephila pilipes TaxID=299642 RepID=A0A8X6PPZ5_NEPPI|nr:hypothetical protein NPIL_625571 [Nephila pilipes]
MTPNTSTLITSTAREDSILKRCPCQRLKQDLPKTATSADFPNIRQVRQAWLTPHISKAVNDSGGNVRIPFQSLCLSRLIRVRILPLLRWR